MILDFEAGDLARPPSVFSRVATSFATRHCRPREAHQEGYTSRERFLHYPTLPA